MPNKYSAFKEPASKSESKRALNKSMPGRPQSKLNQTTEL